MNPKVVQTGRRAKNTLQVDIEIRFDTTEQTNVSDEVLNHLACEEWLKVWTDILTMLEIMYPHISISSQDF